MKDRQPTKILPNGAIRYGVYGENGTLQRYEYMKLEDEPSETGTPLNKATLLSDETVKKVWPNQDTRPEDPTVNQALAKLAEPTAKIGDIMFTTQNPGENWLVCNGQKVKKEDHPELYGVLRGNPEELTWDQKYTYIYPDNSLENIDIAQSENTICIVALGISKIWISDNYGMTFQEKSAAQTLRKIAYGNGFWCALTYSGDKVLYKKDINEAWNEWNAPYENFKILRFINNEFVLINQYGKIITFDEPGKTYLEYEFNSITIEDIDYDGSNYAIFNGAHTEYYYSKNLNGPWTAGATGIEGDGTSRPIVGKAFAHNGTWVVSATDTYTYTGYLARTENIANPTWITSKYTDKVYWPCGYHDGRWYVGNITKASEKNWELWSSENLFKEMEIWPSIVSDYFEKAFTIASIGENISVFGNPILNNEYRITASHADTSDAKYRPNITNLNGVTAYIKAKEE